MNGIIERVCVRTYPWRDAAEACARELRKQGIHAAVPVDDRTEDALPLSRVVVPVSECQRVQDITRELLAGA
jgi:hypothetical protein